MSSARASSLLDKMSIRKTWLNVKTKGSHVIEECLGQLSDNDYHLKCCIVGQTCKYNISVNYC
jgi:hypothetical protein